MNLEAGTSYIAKYALAMLGIMPSNVQLVMQKMQDSDLYFCNLSLKEADKGFSIAILNREQHKSPELIAKYHLSFLTSQTNCDMPAPTNSPKAVEAFCDNLPDKVKLKISRRPGTGFTDIKIWLGEAGYTCMFDSHYEGHLSPGIFAVYLLDQLKELAIKKLEPDKLPTEWTQHN